jgi:hypothetical protein
MISDHDRSGWFGASDTATIMGNWKTKTFGKWWMQKLGLDNSHFASTAMNAGTYYEHAVLDHIGAPRKDHQILLPGLSLRVNLDGDDPARGSIWEVKTHSAAKEFKVSKAYWQQVQVQMFAKSEVERVVPYAEIVAYGLTEEDYRNFFNPIDPARLKKYPIGYDLEFIKLYMRRLEYLSDCLKRGAWPDENTR